MYVSDEETTLIVKRSDDIWWGMSTKRETSRLAFRNSVGRWKWTIIIADSNLMWHFYFNIYLYIFSLIAKRLKVSKKSIMVRLLVSRSSGTVHIIRSNVKRSGLRPLGGTSLTARFHYSPSDIGLCYPFHILMLGFHVRSRTRLLSCNHILFCPEGGLCFRNRVSWHLPTSGCLREVWKPHPIELIFSLEETPSLRIRRLIQSVSSLSFSHGSGRRLGRRSYFQTRSCLLLYVGTS
jgi:hypothetical protein